ncbi:MAG: MmcQ/YjbR family DNA-binding protein [Chloroflexota bacterium]
MSATSTDESMEKFSQPISEHLRSVALALPETSEGTSCVNRAFKVRKKNFLFVGEKDNEVRVMLKLDASLGDVISMNDPRFDVGKTGWVTVKFAPDDVPDESLLSAWVIESFRALGPKTLVKQLDAEAA